jgi:hypothetical protein
MDDELKKSRELCAGMRQKAEEIRWETALASNPRRPKVPSKKGGLTSTVFLLAI